MSEMPVTVTYEDVDGTKTVDARVHVRPGDSRVNIILDIIRVGFRNDLGGGMYEHIPPHRLVKITYRG